MAKNDNELGSGFGALIQRHRRLAGLTQEELAERTELSVRAIRNLELGLVRKPRGDTVIRLVRALRLDASAAVELGMSVRPAPAALPADGGGDSRAGVDSLSLPATIRGMLADVVDEFDGRVLVLPVVLYVEGR